MSKYGQVITILANWSASVASGIPFRSKVNKPHIAN